MDETSRNIVRNAFEHCMGRKDLVNAPLEASYLEGTFEENQLAIKRVFREEGKTVALQGIRLRREDLSALREHVRAVFGKDVWS